MTERVVNEKEWYIISEYKYLGNDVILFSYRRITVDGITGNLYNNASSTSYGRWMIQVIDDISDDELNTNGYINLSYTPSNGYKCDFKEEVCTSCYVKYGWIQECEENCNPESPPRFI